MPALAARPCPPPVVSAHNRRRGLLWGLVGVVAFSLTLPATRFAVVWLDPMFVGLGRAVVAAALAAGVLVGA